MGRLSRELASPGGSALAVCKSHLFCALPVATGPPLAILAVFIHSANRLPQLRIGRFAGRNVAMPLRVSICRPSGPSLSRLQDFAKDAPL